MTSTIRLANKKDAEQIQAIYSPIVSQTAISFELEPPGVAEMRKRISTTMTTFPWLVCEQKGKILGYVYARMFRDPTGLPMVRGNIRICPRGAAAFGDRAGIIYIAAEGVGPAGILQCLCRDYAAQPAEPGSA